MSEQLKAVVTVGVSASGKSTFADEWVKNGQRWVGGDREDRGHGNYVQTRVEVNRDSIRRMLVESAGGSSRGSSGTGSERKKLVWSKNT